MNETSSHLWLVWLAIAALCGIFELIVPSFTFIFASAAALATALVASQFGFVIQLTGFGIVLIFSVFLIRPRLIARLHSEKDLPSRTDALLGKTGRVTETIDPVAGSGRVLVDAQDWSARSSKLVEVGKTILVEGSDGITLIVKEV